MTKLRLTHSHDRVSFQSLRGRPTAAVQRQVRARNRPSRFRRLLISKDCAESVLLD